MDELTLARSFRADAPTITDATHNRIRERVLAIVDAEPTPIARHRRRRLGLWQKPKHRRGRRTLVAISAVAILLAIPALAFAGQLIDFLWPTTPIASDSFSGVSQSMLERISGSSSGTTVEQIATNGSLTYYLVAGQDGQTCLASGTTGTPNVLGAVGPCSNDPSSLLPSTEQPVVLNTIIELDPRTGTIVSVPSVSGLVDDSVHEVELTDANGNVLASTAVTDHVFELNHLEGLPISTLAALDSSGHSLYEKPLPVASK
jgi:hypothetical protein